MMIYLLRLISMLGEVSYVLTISSTFVLNFVDLAYDWLIELSRSLKVNVDYSEDTHTDSLIRNTTIQLTLCIQNSLGFQGEFNPRRFGGKLGWLILQLRSIVVFVTMASSVKRSEGPSGEPTSPLDDPG